MGIAALRYNWISAATVVAGLLAIVLDLLGLLPDEAFERVVLGLLCLLATSEIFDKAAGMRRIEQSVEQSKRAILRAVGTSDVKPLPTSEIAHAYMASAVSMAKQSVRHAAVGPGIARMLPQHKQAYYESILKKLQGSQITYSYVTAFCEVSRLNRVLSWLRDPGVTKYYVAHYLWTTEIPPSVYFMIIDDDEVIARLPKAHSEPDEYVAISDIKLVSLFIEYHRSLWERARKLNDPALNQDELELIEAVLAEPGGSTAFSR